MRIKNNGVWRFGVPKVRIGGTWKTGLTWNKISGTWRALVPNNMIQLSLNTSYTGTGQICDGTNGSPNLIEQYLFEAKDDSILQTGGASLDHSGSLHGDAPASYSGSVEMDNGGASIAFTAGCVTSRQSHNHYVYAHSHTGTATGLRPQNVSVIPIIGDPIIKANTLFFAELSTSALTGFTNVSTTYQRNYVRMASSGGTLQTANIYEHRHGTALAGVNTDTHTVSTTDLQKNSYDWPSSHYHSLEHECPYATNNGTRFYGPVSNKYGAFTCNADMYFSDLPSGIIACFTSRDIPPGWTEINPTTVAYVRIANNADLAYTEIYSESNYHNHIYSAYSGAVMGGSIATANKRHEGTANHFAEFILRHHSHALTGDNHASMVANMPPYTTLKLAKKL